MPELLRNSSGQDAFTAVNTGQWVSVPGAQKSFEAWLGSSGGTGTVEIHASNDNTAVTNSTTRIATITLSGVNDRVPSPVTTSFRLLRANVTALSAGAKLRVLAHGE